MKKFPVYHGSNSLLGCLPDLQKNPITLLADAHSKSGDAVSMRFLYLYCYSFIHPDQLQYIFRGNPSNYWRQTRGDKIIKSVLGDGILTSKADTWQRQRRSALEEMKPSHVRFMTESITNTMEDI